MGKSVLLLSTALSGGGAEYVSRVMASNIIGCRCVLFKKQPQSIPKTLRVQYIPRFQSETVIAKIVQNIFRVIYVQIVKIILSPDVTISHLEGPNFTNMMTWGGGKKVVFVHNSANQNYFEKNVFNRAKKMLIRRLYYRADQVVGVSTDVCKELIKDYQICSDRVLFLPNPIDIENIEHLSNLNFGDWRDQLLRFPFLLNVGSLTFQKNHELLIKVFREALRTYPELKLVLIGKGEREGIIRDVCRKHGLLVCDGLTNKHRLDANVYMLGYQENPYPFLRHSKIFLMTSYWEGLPIALLESFCLGTPVVVSNCSSAIDNIMLGDHAQFETGHSQGYKKTKYGYLLSATKEKFEDDTIGFWSECVTNLLVDDRFRDSCSVSAIEKSKEYDVRIVKKLWEKHLYSSVIG